MKTYEITFQNSETRVMVVTSEYIDPVAEVAKWGDVDLSVANIVSVVEVA